MASFSIESSMILLPNPAIQNAEQTASMSLVSLFNAEAGVPVKPSLSNTMRISAMLMVQLVWHEELKKTRPIRNGTLLKPKHMGLILKIETMVAMQPLELSVME